VGFFVYRHLGLSELYLLINVLFWLLVFIILIF